MDGSTETGTTYGRMDYAMIPELLKAAEVLGFFATRVECKQEASYCGGGTVSVVFSYRGGA